MQDCSAGDSWNGGAGKTPPELDSFLQLLSIELSYFSLERPHLSLRCTGNPGRKITGDKAPRRGFIPAPRRRPVGASVCPPTPPPSPPQDSRPALAELTLDSVCSLPWRRSTEFGPDWGGPHLPTLLPAPLLQRKEQFKYKSALDTNRTSASLRAITGTERPGFLWAASANKQRPAP